MVSKADASPRSMPSGVTSRFRRRSSATTIRGGLEQAHAADRPGAQPVPQHAGLRATRLDLQGVDADQAGAWVEGQLDPPARLVPGDVVADPTVPAVGADGEGPVEPYRHPGGCGPEWVVVGADPVHQSAHHGRGNR